ncbi:hypothetical protein J31TS4_34250 [Paenibacillus sp. J31TS4]|uniref:CotH kinase family protein n=1 Tax=Paenibacillus sp. J31TS4 TaxID=2807195 RepID=UPI001B1DBE2C|nr:CotH kinase family protein [Paenibacillus sp. J31TS4]GIP40145.1 hypothetical protein J31TS4_34250 [Paenibacillus sp. J31TS4]
MKTRRARLLAGLLCLLLAAGLAGCGDASPAASGTGTGGSSPAAASAEEKQLDEQVFPEDKVIDVKVTLDPADFQDMLDNASAEEFKQASVDYNGQHFDNIAIRTKGNLSLRSVVSMPDSDRYSFKLSFDEYVNQTIGGLSKINLNNNYSDATYMREFLSYELAEKMGLPVPKHSFVNLYVNGELRGCYLAVEQVGESYLERYFGNAVGALYKGVMTGSGSDLKWLGDDFSLYTGLKKKSKGNKNDELLQMIEELNNGGDYEKVLDVEGALKYVALNVLTNNTDSYIGGNKQNYYLYENKGVFSVLPWDYNMAFGGLGGGGGYSLLIDEPTQGAVADRPLVAKLLAVDTYKEKYHTILKEAIEGFLASDAFQASVDRLSKLISASVENDPTAFYTYEQYQQAVKQLVTINTTAVQAIAKQLDGKSPSSGDGSGSGGGMGPGGMGGGRGNRGQAPVQGGANAQGGIAAPGAQAPADAQGGASAQGGIAAPGAQAPANAQGGFGGMGGMLPPGGDRGGPGGFGGQTAAQSQGSVPEAVTAGVSLLVLLLACVFVALFRRKRL